MLLFVTKYSAQSNPQKDSLWHVWNSTQLADTSRLNALNQLVATFYGRQQPDSAILLSQEQIRLAEKSANNDAIGRAWYNIALAHDAKGEHKESFDGHTRASEFLKKGTDKMALAKSYAGMGTAARYLGQFAKSLECHQLAYDTHKSIGNLKGMAASTSAIGNVYLAQGYRSSNEDARNESNQKALEYFTSAYTQGEQLADKKLMAMALNNTALVYHEMGRIEESKATHEKVLAMSIEMNNAMYRANALNNLGVSHESLSDNATSESQRDSLLQIALRFYMESWEIRKSLGQIDLVTNSMTNIAALKRRMALNGPPAQRAQLLADAAQMAEECYALTDESGNLAERSHAAQALYEIYRAQGKYKEALESYDVYITTRDSINSEDQRAELLRQELTYDFEKKELEKARQHEQEMLQQRNERNMFIAGGALLLIVIIFLLYVLRARRIAAQVLAEKNAQVEAARAQAELSEQTKQRFLANMSHEIRTPMNAITGLSRLLLDKPQDEQTREYLSAIYQSSENLTVVLNDILDEAKMMAGKLEIRPVAIDLRAVMSRLMKTWSARASEKGLETSLQIDKNLPEYIRTDPARLSQIIGNLLGNAIKFTDTGQIKLHAHLHQGWLRFDVIDTGPGIAPHELDKIFDSFRQSDNELSREKGGTGLGLSIARQLATLMQGSLNAQSEVGKGSVFSLVLQLEIVQAPKLPSNIHPGIHESPFQFLVAEDNDYNFLVTRDTLLKYFPKSEVYRAHNGREALEALAEDEYDLVLMDVHMPELDGYATTRSLRQTNPSIPVIAITASVLNSDIQKCLEAGMNGYVPKPFSEPEFVKAIADVLHLNMQAHAVAVDQDHEDRLFVEMIPAKLESLQLAIRNADRQKITDLAHTLRPQLINNKMNTLAELCYKLEHDGNVDITIIATQLAEGLSLALEKKRI